MSLLQIEGLGIDFARISASPANDHLRLVLKRQFLDLVHVDTAVFFADPVMNEVVQLAREIDGGAVRQVPAMRKVHRQNGVAGLKHRHINGHIRLRAGMRLHVDMVAPKNLLRAFYCKLFRDIDDLAAAVIARVGIALGVLVG